MSHNISKTIDGRDAMAFHGSRNDIWHRLGQEMAPGMSRADWQKAAGLDWQAITVPSHAILPDGRSFNVADDRYIVRQDNFTVLGHGSDRFRPHQNDDLFDCVEQYISVDDRFRFDTAMCLDEGKRVVLTAVYQEPMTVAGDRHIARLMASTAFDGSEATRLAAVNTRVVCNNTFLQALGELARRKSGIKVRHNTRFDKVRAGKELSDIVRGFDTFKAMGDAMAKVHMGQDETMKFFKKLLDIPWDAKKEDISTRKMNQYTDLWHARTRTINETPNSDPNTAWINFNAVTRYIDHDRGTRGGVSPEQQRFVSAQFGAGATMKETAVDYLLTEKLPDRDFWAETKGLVSTLSVSTTSEPDDAALLKSAFAKSPVTSRTYS